MIKINLTKLLVDSDRNASTSYTLGIESVANGLIGTSSLSNSNLGTVIEKTDNFYPKTEKFVFLGTGTELLTNVTSLIPLGNLFSLAESNELIPKLDLQFLKNTPGSSGTLNLRIRKVNFGIIMDITSNLIGSDNMNYLQNKVETFVFSGEPIDILTQIEEKLSLEDFFEI